MEATTSAARGSRRICAPRVSETQQHAARIALRALSLENTTRPSSVVISNAPLLRRGAQRRVSRAPGRSQGCAHAQPRFGLACCVRAPRVHAVHVALHLHVRELVLRRARA